MTTLLGITGSLRRASTNTGLLRALKDMIPPQATLEIATLHGIPLFNEDDEAATGSEGGQSPLSLAGRGDRGRRRYPTHFLTR